MSKKIMLLLFKKSEERDELGKLCEGFTEKELDAILDKLKLPSGPIEELMQAFKDALRKAKKKKTR